MPTTQKTRIKSFAFSRGRILARKYEVLAKLGQGWEGEVYKIREVGTNIERAAKVFLPHRNLKNRTAREFARKLYALRECPMIIQYYTQETIMFRGEPVTALISEYVEGELLSDYTARAPGKRLHVFQAVHLLHALASGIESIHALGEYHGDIHDDNIIVRRVGLSYELKLLDPFYLGRVSQRETRNEDILSLIRVFYDCLGGRVHYHRLPAEVKAVCCGLKRTLILRKFRDISALRRHLETIVWG
jgi:serine/threonine protein kinase